MSYFITYALVSSNTNDVKRSVFQLMEPYDNEYEVEEYETECMCDCGRDEFDPDCEQCAGTGVYRTTWNPMSNFDSYYIWDGEHVLRNASKNPSDWEDEPAIDDNIPDDYDEEEAMAALSDLNIERLELPDVIVTPSGEWHEMPGYWYFDDRESAEWQEWRETVKKILTQWPDAILVVLLCHS